MQAKIKVNCLPTYGGKYLMWNKKFKKKLLKFKGYENKCQNKFSYSNTRMILPQLPNTASDQLRKHVLPIHITMFMC